MEPNGHCSVAVTECVNLLSSNENYEKILIEFVDVNYAVRHHKEKRKVILNSISGYLRPGKLTAIFGPSGAGKTSLLNIIAGYKQSSNSDALITINGVDRNIESFRKKACYVPQEVKLLPLLTVEETLYVAARLKLKKNHEVSRKQAVQDVVKKLGLLECIDTTVQNLSGGEKKRLSIGIEIITSPTVLLLDEPTTGLDSAASNQVIDLLRAMAQSGCTVACTIHQPSSKIISQFDDVIVISQGKCYYCGPQDEIFNSFSVAGFTCPKFFNIAEYVLEVITKQRGGDLEYLQKSNHLKYEHRKQCLSSYQKNDINDIKEEESLDTTYRYITSTWDQIKTLFYRAFICIKRDNTLTKLRLAAHIIVGLLLGIVFYDFGNDAAKFSSNVSCIFFFMIFLFFANSMPAVQMFPIESAVLLRENLNNWYSLHAYHITKVLSDLPMQTLCSSFFIILAYPLTGQPLELPRFFQVWCICTLITILAQSFGIATGALFNTEIGVFLVPACNIPMLLFSGFFLKLGEIPVYLRAFSAISYFRYAFEGALQAIYGSDRSKLPCSIEFCYLRSPERILTKLNMPSVSYNMIVVILLIWIIILHITIYVVLRWKVYSSTR